MPQIDEKRLKSIEAIINSMTAAERADDQPDRRQAPQAHRPRQRHFGPGSESSLKQYADMRRMMKQYGSFAKTKMRGLGKFAGMKPPPGLAGEK